MMNLWNELTGWQIFAYLYFAISIIANVVFTIVITIGGGFDLRHLFRELNKEPDEIHDKKKPEVKNPGCSKSNTC